MKAVQIFLIILLSILVIVLIYTFDMIGDYFKAKISTEKLTMENAKNKKTPLTDRIGSSISLLRMVDALVEVEVDNIFSVLSTLKQRYNILTIDKDIENIARTVFDVIKEDVYNEKDLIFTDEYLMRYITNRATTLMITTTRDANVQLYVNNEEQ